MKLTCVFLTVLFLNVSATGVSQTVSFSGRNVKLKTIFSAIHKQTGYVVFYDNSLIKDADPVTISLMNAPLETFLTASLQGQDLSYFIIDKTITIKKTPPLRVVSPFILPPVTITGRVTDETGAGLPGVTVLVKGTRLGTTTDEKGEFKFTGIDDKAVLVFSYIGYATAEVEVAGRKKVDVMMEIADNTTLESVVVVGYGSIRKSDLTGSVSAVEGKEIAARKTTQISQALQGSMPGVTVTRSNNAPGATATIRVRGITTLNDAGASPLIILDGVPVDDINSINPNDVDNISVLKDAASASIYGSRAAAGVILVTTKRAKSGQLSLDYTYEYGVEKPTVLPDYVDVKRFMQLTNELRWNDNGNNTNEYPTYPKATIDNYDQLHADNPDEYPDTDWRSMILHNSAPRQSHILSVSGGGKTIRSRVSLAYDKTDALYDDRTYERLTARINNDITINKYLSASVDINFRRSIIKQPTVNPMYKMGIVPPLYAAMWSDGRIGAGKDGANIYAQLKYGGFDHDWYNQIGGKIGLDFTPIEGLKFSGIISPFAGFDKMKTFNKKVPYTSWNNPNSVSGYIEGANETKLSENRNDNQRYTIQALANYTKQLGSHNLNILAGYEYFYAFDEGLGASRGQYILDNYPYLNLGPLEFRDNSGNATENAYRSWFGRVMYNYKDRYLLQANIRYDASSRFAPGYRWGSFPSVSAGWIISQEPFMSKTSNWLSFLKVRASWGTLGNERIGDNFYPYQALLRFETNSLFYRGNTAVSAQSAAQWQYIIRDISWETTESYDFGMDVNFLDNRLRVTADYYRKTTRDILLELEIPDYIGFDNPYQNTGNMYTTGWEFQAGWNDKIGDFTYSVSANISDFVSKMGDLGGTEFLGDKIKTFGSEFDEWYGYLSDGLFQTQDEVDKSPTLNANTRPGDVRYKDISGPNGVPDGKISPEYDRVLLGGSLPRYMYGATLQGGYKNWNLGIVIQGVGKQNSRLTTDIVRPLLENYGNFPLILDGASWSHYNTPEQNLQAKYPRYSNTAAGNNYTLSDYWLIKGSYFRLKNVNLSYTVPRSLTERIKIQDLRVYGAVSDLFSLHHFPKGWDPEWGRDASNNLGYPITMSFVFGVSVKF
ncbi:TonB-dependent receptor [Chitinophaga cymbidii]|uniref:SusC/RagA family TonB-linked outer membrane protein n=1 Tax=Chitinophaga cymbidii TaxID=1096750 RepID=A0A512RJB4_9BACT|nr:TonB-dependent receptor [Chitinophaga cymbidii]GEP95801.1 SusC/RagA family TonB-linked outer membrane protein [Chitinophaga cymbidii]